MGLIDFINLCFADETDRAVSSASIQGTMAFNLLTPPQVRLLLGTRWFDSRPLLAGLSDADRERLMALTPKAIGSSTRKYRMPIGPRPAFGMFGSSVKDIVITCAARTTLTNTSPLLLRKRDTGCHRREKII